MIEFRYIEHIMVLFVMTNELWKSSDSRASLLFDVRTGRNNKLSFFLIPTNQNFKLWFFGILTYGLENEPDMSIMLLCSVWTLHQASLSWEPRNPQYLRSRLYSQTSQGYFYLHTIYLFVYKHHHLHLASWTGILPPQEYTSRILWLFHMIFVASAIITYFMLPRTGLYGFCGT